MKPSLRPSTKFKKQLFIFDLDGTLIDSQQDIVTSVNLTLQHYGKPPLSTSEITRHVGRGVAYLLRHTLGDDQNLFKDAHDFLLCTYLEHCTQQTTLYPGVNEVLLNLQATNKALTVCTNKPIEHALKTMEHLGLHSFFEQIIGGDSLDTKKPDPEGIETILAAQGLDREDAVMVGDSEVDIKAGKRAGIMTCACSYGLRSFEHLESHQPDVFIRNFSELVEVFE